MNMNSRWKLEIKGLNQEPTLLHAEPIPDIMTDYVKTATDELARRCALSEEQMIFESSADFVLERIRDVCDKILRSRRES